MVGVTPRYVASAVIKAPTPKNIIAGNAFIFFLLTLRCVLAYHNYSTIKQICQQKNFFYEVVSPPSLHGPGSFLLKSLISNFFIQLLISRRTPLKRLSKLFDNHDNMVYNIFSVNIGVKSFRQVDFIFLELGKSFYLYLR